MALLRRSVPKARSSPDLPGPREAVERDLRRSALVVQLPREIQGGASSILLRSDFERNVPGTSETHDALVGLTVEEESEPERRERAALLGPRSDGPSIGKRLLTHRSGRAVFLLHDERQRGACEDGGAYRRRWEGSHERGCEQHGIAALCEASEPEEGEAETQLQQRALLRRPACRARDRLSKPARRDVEPAGRCRRLGCERKKLIVSDDGIPVLVGELLVQARRAASKWSCASGNAQATEAALPASTAAEKARAGAPAAAQW